MALVPLLSGCWPQIGHGPAHRRSNPDETTLTRVNVETLEEAWSATAEGAFSEPIVVGDRVYASWAPTMSLSAATAQVRAVDVGSGATVWETTYFSYGGRFTTADVPVVLAGDQLWAGADALTLLSPPACIAGDARLTTDGSVISAEVGTLTHSPAVEATGTVVRTRKPCARSIAELEVRDAATDVVRWTAVLPGGPHLSTVVANRIVVVGGTQLLGFPLAGCGSAVCRPEWSVDLGSHVAGNMVVGGFRGEVLMVTAAAELVAVDAATGDELWRVPAGMNGHLAVTEDAVFVGGGDTLRAFDPEGQSLWTGSLGGEARGAPVTAGGVVYQGTGSTVRAFDAAGCGAATCDALASVTVTGGVSHLSVARGQLFVSSSITTGSPPSVSTTGYLTAFAPTGAAAAAADERPSTGGDHPPPSTVNGS